MISEFPLHVYLRECGVILYYQQVPYTAMEGVSNSKIMTEVRKVYNLVEPYGLVSAYGVDHKALKEDGRPEIIIEGSMDQQKWTVREKKASR